MYSDALFFFFSSRRRHTRCALVTGVQTCALPICLESIVVAGAPSTPETFAWFYRSVKQDLWVTSQSGGTELCSGFVGAAPTLPVHAGEIQKRLLGMDVHAFTDDGVEVVAEVGELVVTTPFPSMPIRFWNDEGDKRSRHSDFEVFQNVDRK